MESKVITIAIEMMKLAMYLSFPVLLVSMIVGLMISIFQATTQINEMTLSFVPKLIAVAGVMIFTAPWMMNMIIDFTKHIMQMIPSFIQ
ncbi:MAG: flagellar biosynthesis protein FliQ [Epsilonproteobacteria bacterium]|nr:flagellar biosynthesis protein FliQ [Campylobacterota bacterium]